MHDADATGPAAIPVRSSPDTRLPLVVEPAELERRLVREHLLIVDLGRAETYAQAHLPGAVYVDYASIVTARPPAMGATPDETRLGEILSAIGLTPTTPVVAYGDEGGAKAARFLWTLEALGHAHYSLLNGGIHAWVADNRPLTREPPTPARSRYSARLTDGNSADKNYILQHLGDPAVALLDCRTPGEYRGETRRAARGGHIPGAVNYDWVNALDRSRALRLRPTKELRQEFGRLGVTADREVIVYCQTHHRSAHTWLVLKYLGYPRVRGYPGSWSEWGNSPDTPIET